MAGPLGWRFRRLAVWALDLDGDSVAPPAPSEPPSEAVLREVPAGAVDSLAAAMGDDAGSIPGRFARGGRCLVASVGDRVAAFAWIAVREEWIGEIESVFLVPPGEAYVWNCVTLPPYRRRGMYRALLDQAAATCRTEGVTRLWIATMRDVPAASRGAVRAGFRRALDVGFISIDGMSIRWLTAGRSADPRLAAAARRGLGVRLRLSRPAPALVH